MIKFSSTKFPNDSLIAKKFPDLVEEAVGSFWLLGPAPDVALRGALRPPEGHEVTEGLVDVEGGGEPFGVEPDRIHQVGVCRAKPITRGNETLPYNRKVFTWLASLGKEMLLPGNLESTS